MCWTSQVQTAIWIWTCRCGRSICWQLRVRRRRCAIRSSRMPSAASTHAEVVKRVRQSRSSSRKSRKAEAIQSQQEQAEAPEPAVDRCAENTLGLSEGQAKANGAASAPAVKVPEPAEPPLPEAEPEPDARLIAPVATDTPAGTEAPRRHRHRGSGDSASSAVAIAKRQLTELAAHGLKAEPQKVVSALRKEFPQRDRWQRRGPQRGPTGDSECAGAQTSGARRQAEVANDLGRPCRRGGFRRTERAR